MNQIEELLDIDPFSVSSKEKSALLIPRLNNLTSFHTKNCSEYSKIQKTLGNNRAPSTIEKVPFIPVRLFKELDLKSIPDEQVFKILTSSGTSGQRPSRIYIDKTVAENQRKVLAKLTSKFIGPSRLPMLIIDSKSTLKDPRSFSARGAGILGFSMFGKNITYALDEKMELDLEAIYSFVEVNKGSDILLFGFTSVVWENFVSVLDHRGINLDLDKGILIHGGGWKKLASRNITNKTLKDSLNKTVRIKRIYDYYGMIEQTGSIFFECEEGYMHTSIFSDLVIRDDSLKPLPHNKKGLVQILSIIPTSYPGHSLLSEDLGEIFGEDDCKCKKMGKYFKIHGRIPNSEIRGCSDTINQ